MLIKEFLKRNRENKVNIHICGDAIIDQYTSVTVNRLSQEAPIPIMKGSEIVKKPGGAANVWAQLKHFNVESKLVCLPDYTAPFRGFGWEKVYKLGGLPIKNRFMAGNIQIARHDIETDLCGWEPEGIENYITSLETELETPDVAILSDYGKGFFSGKNMLDFYKNCTTIIDPKNGPLRKWHGCTIFKPNAEEARNLTDLVTWQDQAKYIHKELECQAVVITHGGDGVHGIIGNELFSYTPKTKVSAISTVGAGDAFIGFLAMAVAQGFNVAEAAEIAYLGGEKYVSGHQPVCPADLCSDIEPEDLAHRDFKLIMTNGIFDYGLTYAHVKCMEFAKSQGDRLVVALNSDSSTKRLKGSNRPIMPLQERLAIVKNIKHVDYVVSFEEDTPLEIIHKIKPDLIVKGGQEYTEENIVSGGYPVKICPTFSGLSTTQKINKCKN